MPQKSPKAAGTLETRHGWLRGPARRAAVSVVAVGVGWAIACSSPGATPTETTPRGAGAAPAAATEAAATSTEAYLALVSRVNLAALRATTLLSRLALIVTTDDDVRSVLEDDVLLILDSLELQRDLLLQAAPVPAAMEEVHALLLTAMERYIEATSLLLPQSSGGPERFDFFSFQPIVQEGGKNFHGAGAALP